MDHTINMLRLERINTFIKLKQTGNPVAFARHLNISKATLYRYLRIMRTTGAPIEYDKHRETYYYDRPGEFQMRFFEKPYEPVLSEDKPFFFSDS